MPFREKASAVLLQIYTFDVALTIFVLQENAVPVDCPTPNNGHQRKCHMYQKEVLPYDDPCCECSHGTVYNGTSCIDESRCPCEENGIIRLPDEEWKDPEDECQIKSEFHTDFQMSPC